VFFTENVYYTQSTVSPSLHNNNNNNNNNSATEYDSEILAALLTYE
jgi:hypothetical protein